MSKSNTWENDLLLLLFNNTNAANIGDGTGLRGSSVVGVLYVSLHSDDPSEAGNQTTNEIVYTDYARVSVERTGVGWTVTANSVSPTANIDFPACTGLTDIARYFGIGTDISGTGKLLYSGTITPNISISDGVIPRLTTASTITED